MFSIQVIDTDQFLDMPASAQSLYFHLGMRADDDGFVSSPRKIMKVTNCGDDDYKLLLAKQFVIPFDSGICVIRHWRIHNYIQRDRYHETIYKAEKNQVTLENNHYETMDTACIHDASRMDTEVRLGKVSQGKASQGKASGEEQPPEQTDAVIDTYRNELSARLPATAWRNLGDQSAALRRVAKMTRETQPQTPIDSPEEFAALAVQQYQALKERGKNDYWKTAAFDPLTFERRFSDVVTALAEHYGEAKQQEDGLEAMRRMGVI